jgi:hypothetical protein
MQQSLKSVAGLDLSFGISEGLGESARKRGRLLEVVVGIVKDSRRSVCRFTGKKAATAAVQTSIRGCRCWGGGRRGRGGKGRGGARREVGHPSESSLVPRW